MINHTSSDSKLINGFNLGGSGSGSGSGSDETDESDDVESSWFPVSNCGLSDESVVVKSNLSYGTGLKIFDFNKKNF